MPALGKRARRTAVLIALATTLLMAAWMSAGPISNANAYAFCTNAHLSAYGSPTNDTCAAGWGGGLLTAQVTVQEHSGCVSVLNSAGNLSRSWQCTPGPWTYTWIQFNNDGVYRRAIIRNNTTGDTNHLSGSFYTY